MDSQEKSASRQESSDGSSEITSCNDSNDESDEHSSEESQEGFSYLRLSRRHKCIIVSFCTTSFIIMMSESIMSPLYPEETRKRGVSNTVSGWVFASYAFGQMVFSPLAGKYLSKIGTRFAYLAGVFFTGGCTLLFGILGDIPVSDGPTIFVVYTFIMQISLAAGVVATQTAEFSMTSKEFGANFTSVFGLMEVFVGLGMTVGPAVGGFLYNVGGFQLPFIVVGCMVAMCLPFDYFLVPVVRDNDDDKFLSTNDIEEDKVDKKEDKSTVSTTLAILRDPTAVITLLSVMSGAAMWAVLEPILEPRCAEFGLTPEVTGVMFLILSASYALCSPISSWIADRLPDNRMLMIPGFIICAISHLLLGASPILGFDPDYKEIWLTVLSLVTLGTGISFAIIPSYEIILDVALEAGLDDNMITNSAVAGIFCTMYAAGDFVGPIFGGWMQDSGGFSWTLTYTGLASVLTVGMLILSALYDKKCRTNNPKRTSEEKNEKVSLLDRTTYTEYDYLTFDEVYRKSMLIPHQMP